MPQAAQCYRALQTRDARFDGRFFVGVRTTGVYCRPVCPARTPRRENCTFYASAAAAQEAGFRPCLRCRPEASPGTPAWAGTHSTVARALRLIEQGILDDGDVSMLAVRLGVGDRHLRRLFLRHLGAPPVAVAQTRRLLFAKQLLDETDLPMTRVALGAGYGSLRRFNHAVQGTYGRSPRELRRARRRPAADGAGKRRGATESGISLRLPYRPPFHWEALVGFLAPRAIPGVEEVSSQVYRRTVTAGDARGRVSVRPVAGENALLARIELDAAVNLVDVAERLRRIFDLGADPAAIAGHLGGDRRLALALEALPGVRIPGAWDPFEIAVRAILGQQVTVAGATTLAGRLVEAWGEPADTGREEGHEEKLVRFFPRADVLAGADVARIGLPRARAEAIRCLARAVAEDPILLEGAADLEATVARLCALPGIGPWTAHYVALRACQDPDAFPESDLGLRKALAGKGPPLAPSELSAVAEAWRPWRGYAAVLLWSHGASGSSGAKGSSRRGSRP